jgi:hypothetical protein
VLCELCGALLFPAFSAISAVDIFIKLLSVFSVNSVVRLIFRPITNLDL